MDTGHINHNAYGLQVEESLIVIVGSSFQANYRQIRWFLREKKLCEKRFAYNKHCHFACH